MNFLDLNFLLFSAVVAGIAWFVRDSVRLRDVWLLFAGFVFLSSWNWQSCMVAILNAGAVFTVGKRIVGSDGARRRWYLVLGIGMEVVLLFLARRLMVDSADGEYRAQFLSGVFLVGLSFLTLQNVAYLTQLYRREAPSASSFFNFLLFSIYFPKILVGPLEDYSSFNARLVGPRSWNMWEALYLITLGFFKNLVISNRILVFYREMIAGYSTPEKPMLAIWAAIVMTSMTMYCDFSALSDIGRGVSRLLGIELARNFNQPYLASSPFDYWGRWHITMSEWMRRHIYFPVMLKYKNVFLALSVTMLAVALWHGTSPWLFWWAGAWILFQYGYMYIREHYGWSASGWRKILAVLFTFHMSGLIGLYTVHRLFFEPQFPDFSSMADHHSVKTLSENFQVWIFILIMIGFESYERRQVGRGFYVVAAILLAWLTARFMSGTSYLFYYIRI
ncbi:MAG: hypothetical protein IPJ84_13665 [Bdellovibrionales bacterium]|nr:hypothetical protein [Bdellovibrionales bacterium]